MSTQAILIMLPFLAVLVALTYTIVRTLSRVWLDYRVRMALLEKLEDQPELLERSELLRRELTDEEAEYGSRRRQDFSLTGVILAIVGALCVILYGSVEEGRTAAGVYIGGLICLVLGFLLAVLGLLIRYLSRPPIQNE